MPTVKKNVNCVGGNTSVCSEQKIIEIKAKIVKDIVRRFKKKKTANISSTVKLNAIKKVCGLINLLNISRNYKALFDRRCNREQKYMATGKHLKCT